MQRQHQASEQSHNHDQPQDPIIASLCEQLDLMHQENRRTRHYLFIVTLLAVCIIVFLLVSKKQTWIDANAQTVTFGAGNMQPMDPALREKTRHALQSGLPEAQRKELQEFEAQVSWLKNYMKTWDQGDAGAIVALMLHRMAQNMKTMPGMETQMNNMSANMQALPIIANQLAQINGKMTVIAQSMDDTLGRSGRFMPW
jgi:hypothetical protein